MIKERDVSVLHGSVAGPHLYSAYASTMAEVVEDSNKSVYGFVDDHAPHNCFSAHDRLSEHEAVLSMKKCLSDIYTEVDGSQQIKDEL